MVQNTNRNKKKWRRATHLVRGGTERSNYGETSEALFLTSGYVYDGPSEAEARFKGEAPGFVYSRFGNPTVAMFEQRLALLEGAEACKATSTGMAAVFAALMCQLQAGDHVVASRALFGSCLYIVSELLPRYGIETTLVDGTDLAQWRAAFRSDTRCAFLESPSNPTLEVIDVRVVAEMARQCGARLIVDNVFATPLLQPVLEMGADIVVYSATKHIDGQGRCLGGAILSNQDFVDDKLLPFLRHTGPSLSPFNAWVLLKGLETLELRVERMCDNALNVATFLEKSGVMEKVLYPGLESHPQHALVQSQMSAGGTIISFETPGGKVTAFQLLERLKLIDISNNLGDSKSLITHPATTTHQRLQAEERTVLGISDGLLRLSVGLEDPEDIKDDLSQAMGC